MTKTPSREALRVSAARRPLVVRLTDDSIDFFDRSAAGELDAVALRLEAGGGLLAVISLDLDGAVLHGAARPAVPFEVARDLLHIARAAAR